MGHLLNSANINAKLKFPTSGIFVTKQWSRLSLTLFFFKLKQLIHFFLHSIFFLFKIFIYLAVPGLSYGMQDLLIVSWESLLPQLEMEPSNQPCIGNLESYPLDHQERPYSSFFK